MEAAVQRKERVSAIASASLPASSEAQSVHPIPRSIANIVVTVRAPAAPRRARTNRWKRACDFALAAGLSVLLAPVLAVIWLLVRLSSAGPGLYWSERVGRYGKPFAMPKFRTMAVNAPRVPREGFANAEAHVTPIGKYLRRWSVDELPQLWCVLKGEMSFVGPRPLLPEDPAQIARADFPSIALVRPGLSGLAQVKGRNFVTPRRKARLDAHYAKSISPALDVTIFARTITILTTGHGVL